jgi:hypothetical protein
MQQERHFRTCVVRGGGHVSLSHYARGRPIKSAKASAQRWQCGTHQVDTVKRKNHGMTFQQLEVPLRVHMILRLSGADERAYVIARMSPIARAEA